MAYGEIKIDSITFTANGSDTTVSVSGLVQNPTFSGDITVTGTISGDIVQGGTLVSGATVSGTAGEFGTLTGGTAGFTTITGTTVTGTTANFITVSGTTVTGGNGNFTTVTTTTANITSGVFASGTAGAPSVSVGTTDNGFYSPGTDQLALSTSGTGRLFVDASGRVGIGTTSPTSILSITGSSQITHIYTGATNGFAVGQFNSSGDASVNNTANAPLLFATNNTERARIDSSGRLLIGKSSASGAAPLQVQTPTTLSATLDTGVSFVNTSTKTYPTTAGYNVYPGIYQELELGNAQVVDPTTPGGYNFVYGFRNKLTKSAGNTQDIERLYFYGFYNDFTWDDANTCRVYSGIIDLFTYRGVDANGRTSVSLRADYISLLPPDGATQSIANCSTVGGLNINPQGSSTVNITNSQNMAPYLYIRNVNAGTKTVNITTHTFFGTGSSWGVLGTTGTMNATITDLYGLRLGAPAGSFTVTNNWGISQEWSSAKNWFAGESNQFPNITTTASAANAFLDSADSNRLYRSTSSIVYKKDVEDLYHSLADNIHQLRPVWYRSKCEADRQDWSWFGLIAEEVAAIEPRLIHYGYQEDAYELVDVIETVELEQEDPRRESGQETEEITRQERRLKSDAQQVPNGVAYDRLTVLLLDVVQRQEDRIKDLENRLATLEGA